MSEPLKKRAAAYIRVSSEEQKEGWSLDGQQQRIQEFVDRNTEYEIIQTYQDDITGKKDDRPGFKRMVMDAQAGLIQAILLVHTSRLFRNVALSRLYKDLFRNQLGIEVIFVNQPIVVFPHFGGHPRCQNEWTQNEED